MTRRIFTSRGEVHVYLDPNWSMDVMMDEATGYDEERAEAFIRWVAENVWGHE